MRLTAVVCIGNPEGMKVAVSIPDEVFAEAEALAKRLKRRFPPTVTRWPALRHHPTLSRWSTSKKALMSFQCDFMTERSGRGAIA
jgi:hypothetical protein